MLSAGCGLVAATAVGASIVGAGEAVGAVGVTIEPGVGVAGAATVRGDAVAMAGPGVGVATAAAGGVARATGAVVAAGGGGVWPAHPAITMATAIPKSATTARWPSGPAPACIGFLLIV
jgi:hypothetical protein